MLAYYGIADLAASSMHAQISTLFWSVQAPFRAAFFMFLCVWSYSLRPGGLFVDRAEALRLGTRKGAGEDLGNGIILTWAFLEMMCWFWVSASPHMADKIVKRCCRQLILGPFH